MRVGIDVTSCLNPRGYGRFARGLVSALLSRSGTHQFVLLSDSQTAGRVDLPTGAAEWVVVPTRRASVDAASHGGRRSLGELWAMAAAVARQRLDVLFFPTVYTFFPVISSARLVVGFHDVIPEEFPELVFPERRGRRLWNLKTRLARFQADLIMTVSEHSKRGIQRQFGWPADKVWVVDEAPDPVFRRLAPGEIDDRLLAAHGLDRDGRLLVYVGGINPHKNLGAVLGALARLRRRPELADLTLVIVGETSEERFTPGLSELRERIATLSLEDCVRFTGYLPDEQVVHLLNRAQALVLPSMAEGYGLPAVEAAACGTPVVATRNSPLPDLLAGGGLFVDPHDPEDLRAALERLLGDDELRRELGETARQRTTVLSWDRSAAQMLELLAAMERPRP